MRSDEKQSRAKVAKEAILNPLASQRDIADETGLSLGNVIESCANTIIQGNKEIKRRLDSMKISEIRDYLDIMEKITGNVNDRNVSKRLRFLILKRDDFTCRYCGRKSPDVILHIDHIKPYSKGGLTEEQNLVTSCADCNLGKSNLYTE